MTDGFRDSDKIFIQFEEKQMKFKEKRRKEEREFMLHMVQMIQGGMGGNSCHLSYGEPYMIMIYHLLQHHQIMVPQIINVCEQKLTYTPTVISVCMQVYRCRSLL